MSVVLMLTLLLGTKPDRPDLGGRVVNQAGEPLRDATAFIYTAAVSELTPVRQSKRA